MNDYLICATRIEELLIFLCHVNDNYLNEIFFKEIDYSIDCYYFYLQNIGKEVSEANFDIVKLNKINRVSLKEDNFYLSSLNIQPFKGEQFTKLEYFFATVTAKLPPLIEFILTSIIFNPTFSTIYLITDKE